MPESDQDITSKTSHVTIVNRVQTEMAFLDFATDAYNAATLIYAIVVFPMRIISQGMSLLKYRETNGLGRRDWFGPVCNGLINSFRMSPETCRQFSRKHPSLILRQKLILHRRKPKNLHHHHQSWTSSWPICTFMR